MSSPYNWRKRVAVKYGKPWREVFEDMEARGVLRKDIAKAFGVKPSTLSKYVPPKSEIYEGKKATHWAEEFGVNYFTFKCRRYQFVTLGECVEAHKRGWVDPRCKTYRGRTTAEWAAQVGITPDAMLKRVKKTGWHEAVSKPADNRGSTRK